MKCFFCLRVAFFVSRILNGIEVKVVTEFIASSSLHYLSRIECQRQLCAKLCIHLFLIDSLKQRASLFRLLTAKLRRTPTTHLTWINSVLNTSSTRFTGFRHRSAAHCPRGFQASLHHTPAVATTVSVLGFHKPTPSHIKDLSR